MKTGDRFQHFKGGYYTLVGMAAIAESRPVGVPIGTAIDSEDLTLEYVVYDLPPFKEEPELALYGPGKPGEKMVVYQSEKNFRWWARPLENFLATVERGGVPMARFTKLRKE